MKQQILMVFNLQNILLKQQFKIAIERTKIQQATEALKKLKRKCREKDNLRNRQER
jgi:hypothetical protein